MRTFRTSILSVVLVMAAGIAGAFAQQLQNASFEDAETETENLYGDLAARWGRWGNWMNRETQWTPTRSGQCLMGYHHWRIEEPEVSGFYQDVSDIPDGTLCMFSIFAYRDEGTNAESVELRIEKMGGFEVLASRVLSMEEIRKNGWGKISVTGTTRGGGVRVLVAVTPLKQGFRQGAIKFDDAELIFQND